MGSNCAHARTIIFGPKFIIMIILISIPYIQYKRYTVTIHSLRSTGLCEVAAIKEL